MWIHIILLLTLLFVVLIMNLVVVFLSFSFLGLWPWEIKFNRYKKKSINNDFAHSVLEVLDMHASVAMLIQELGKTKLEVICPYCLGHGYEVPSIILWNSASLSICEPMESTAFVCIHKCYGFPSPTSPHRIRISTVLGICRRKRQGESRYTTK